MGFLRFTLAMLVFAYHIAYVPTVGPMAVQAFFVLSGFLMTQIMHSDYADPRTGFWRFWLNRILRLYPMHFALAGLSVVVILILGEQVTRRFTGPLFLPDSLSDWVQNLTLIYWSFFPLTVEPRLNDTSWALTLELFYYFLISIGLSRTKKRTWIWFAAGLAWFIFVIATNRSPSWAYDHLLAGSLPFSIGALIWHYRSQIDERIARMSKPKLRPEIALVLAGSGGLLVISMVRGLIDIFGWPHWIDSCGFLAYGFASAVLVMGITRVTVPVRWKGLDKVAGDLSYPVYLSHWTFGVVAAQITGLDVPGRNLNALVTAILTALIMLPVCWLLVHYIDRPIARLRDGVRGRVRSF
jgi:peptidoglycan/LPS O-acetylase OafA/YrhL